MTIPGILFVQDQASFVHWLHEETSAAESGLHVATREATR